jgi:type I restriction enzyme, S subunit
VPQESETTAKLTNAITMSGSDAMSLPNGWEIKKLGDVCENLDSQRKPITQRDRISGDVPYYGATGIVDYVKDFLFNEKLVLLGEDGAKWNSGDACAFIINGKTWVNNHAHVLRPNRKVISDEWLVYNLLLQDLSPYVSGMTVPKLNQGNMNQILIPLPPLPDQQRIVSILDKTFAAIDKAKTNLQQNLQNAKELFESYLQNVFENPSENWEKMKWGELCHFVRGPFGGSLKKSIFKKEGYVVYEQKHAIHDHFNQLRYFIDEEKFNEMIRFEVKPGDIIMSCSGATLGKVAVVPDVIKRGIINQALLKLTPKKNVSVDFLKHWLRSKVFQDIIVKYSGGAAIPNVPAAKILKDILIPIPRSIKEQLKAVKDIEDISVEIKRTIELFQQKLSSLDELKKSILQKAFAGELTAAPKLYATDVPASSIAAEPEAAYPKPALTKQQAFLHKLMLASHIVYELCEEKTFGHTKFMKLLYLCEQAGGMALQTNYKKFAAGPFDGKTLTLIDKEFEKNKWFEIIKTKFTIGGKEREATSYKRTEKSLLYKKHFDNYFANEAVTINNIIELFRKEVTDTVEIVATLFYVWKEFLANGSDVVINKLVTGFYKFHPDKKKFKPQQIEEGYQFMLNNSVFPVT